MDKSRLPHTKQAQGYAEYMRTVYGPDTRVYKDGGTVEFYDRTAHDTTTSYRTAETWFTQGHEVYLTRSCSPTVFEVWNATKRTRRNLAGTRTTYRYNR